MTEIRIELRDEEFAALTAVALDQCRSVDMQALWLLRECLGELAMDNPSSGPPSPLVPASLTEALNEALSSSGGSTKVMAKLLGVRANLVYTVCSGRNMMSPTLHRAVDKYVRSMPSGAPHPYDPLRRYIEAWRS